MLTGLITGRKPEEFHFEKSFETEPLLQEVQGINPARHPFPHRIQLLFDLDSCIDPADDGRGGDVAGDERGGVYGTFGGTVKP